MGILAGITLVLAGLVLLASVIGVVPALGPYLAKAGKKLSTFQTVIGVVALVVGVIEILA